MVKIHTNYGVITLTLFADKAPITVANFLDYVKEGFYDNTIFHRVIDGFMVQGGGFEPGMGQKESKATIQNEANNGLVNSLGTVAMARTNEPHSATYNTIYSSYYLLIIITNFLDISLYRKRGRIKTKTNH